MSPEISDAVDHVKSGCYDGGGRVCDFYTVSNNTGAKVFRKLDIATDNMESQTLLYNFGYAPEVRSEVINFKDGNNRSRYMFLTELAKTVMDICDEEDLHCCNCDIPYEADCNCYMGHDFYDHERFEDINQLQHDMQADGFIDNDSHWGNYGYLEDNTPVVVDCEFIHRND